MGELVQTDGRQPSYLRSIQTGARESMIPAIAFFSLMALNEVLYRQGVIPRITHLNKGLLAALTLIVGSKIVLAHRREVPPVGRVVPPVVGETVVATPPAPDAASVVAPTRPVADEDLNEEVCPRGRLRELGLGSTSWPVRRVVLALAERLINSYPGDFEAVRMCLYDNHTDLIREDCPWLREYDAGVVEEAFELLKGAHILRGGVRQWYEARRALVEERLGQERINQILLGQGEAAWIDELRQGGIPLLYGDFYDVRQRRQGAIREFVGRIGVAEFKCFQRLNSEGDLRALYDEWANSPGFPGGSFEAVSHVMERASDPGGLSDNSLDSISSPYGWRVPKWRERQSGGVLPPAGRIFMRKVLRHYATTGNLWALERLLRCRDRENATERICAEIGLDNGADRVFKYWDRAWAIEALARGGPQEPAPEGWEEARHAAIAERLREVNLADLRHTLHSNDSPDLPRSIEEGLARQACLHYLRIANYPVREGIFNGHLPLVCGEEVAEAIESQGLVERDYFTKEETATLLREAGSEPLDGIPSQVDARLVQLACSLVRWKMQKDVDLQFSELEGDLYGASSSSSARPKREAPIRPTGLGAEGVYRREVGLEYRDIVDRSFHIEALLTDPKRLTKYRPEVRQGRTSSSSSLTGARIPLEERQKRLLAGGWRYLGDAFDADDETPREAVTAAEAFLKAHRDDLPAFQAFLYGHRGEAAVKRSSSISSDDDAFWVAHLLERGVAVQLPTAEWRAGRIERVRKGLASLPIPSGFDLNEEQRLRYHALGSGRQEREQFVRDLRDIVPWVTLEEVETAFEGLRGGSVPATATAGFFAERGIDIDLESEEPFTFGQLLALAAYSEGRRISVSRDAYRRAEGLLAK